ncbi:MAG: O-antigen ligase family protein [Candidatus Metalachnospira sp.]|nr:O-antigen ligase family protein [Candidatus Metalachnospira sp.]
MENNLISELTKERTLKEIFLLIKEEWLEKAAAFLLCLICIFPLLGHFLIINLDYTRLNFANNTVGRIGVLFGIFLMVWNHFKRNDVKYKYKLTINNGLPVFLFAMLIWSVFSCIFSTNPVVSFYGDSYRLDGLSTYIAYAGIFILALHITSNELYKLISEVFVASAAILSLICLINCQQLNFAFSIFFPNKGIFANINHFGYYLCMALPVGVGLFVTDKKTYSKVKNTFRAILRVSELALLSHSLIEAKSMGPLIAVIAALFALIILTVFVNKKLLKRVLCAVVIVVSVSFATCIGTWNIFGDFKKTATDASILREAITNKESNEDTNNSESNDSEQQLLKIGSNRGILWVNAVKFIKEKPLFGYGPDNLGEAYAKAGADNDRPHNEILQFAASLGIPAAVFYISGLVCLLLMLIKKFKRISMEVLCSYCVIGSYLVSSMFGNTMFYTSPFYFMLLGLCYARIREIL